jgi:ATP-dependent helicase HrpB
MPEQETPEILAADLADLALALAEWGGPSAVSRLRWLDSPPAAMFASATALLGELGAIDGEGKVTAHGRRMLSVGTHPRLANMILRSEALGLGSEACDIAALLEERDLPPFRQGPRQADLRLRLDMLRDRPGGGGDGAIRQVRTVADGFRRRLGIADREGDPGLAGVILGFAFPDRIARRRGGADPVYLLSCGRAATFAGHETISDEEFLTVAELDDRDRDARILLAAPLTRDDLDRHFGDRIRRCEVVAWNDREGLVEARLRQMLGEIILAESPLRNPDTALVAAALVEGIRKAGLSCLPWEGEAENLRGRLRLVARLEPDGGWPEVSDAALLDTLGEWLVPHLGGVRRREDLGKIDLAAALKGRLDRAQLARLDRLAPVRLRIPGGPQARLDYRSGDVPTLSARVQELFGVTAHPCVGGGKVPVLVKILSPAMRPVQSTSDLPGFWRTSYPLVRKDLRGRYPRHAWPEDPLA